MGHRGLDGSGCGEVISSQVPESQDSALASTSCGGSNEGNALSLRCPEGQMVTAVRFASYGTPGGSCGGFTQSSCHASTSSSLVEELCLGKSVCTLPVTNATFGDPCVGTYKRLRLELSCDAAPTDSRCAQVNEGSTLTLSCPQGEAIASIDFASYGTPSGACGSWSQSACHASTSAAVLTSACVGKTSCTLSATNATFGDPCVGTYKKLGAQVRCAAPQPEPAPQPTPTPQPTDGFVRVCGTGLCLGSKPFFIHGATTYGMMDDPAQVVALAKQAKLNTLELVVFELDYHTFASLSSEGTWARVDRMIGAASQNGLKVILNLSSYGHAIRDDLKQKPTTYDWNPFLTQVMSRTNTVTGVRYANDSTIAMIELLGEIDAPNYGAPQRGTPAELTAFFKRTLAQLRAVAPKHVISTGGFSYINDPGSGIDWKTIMADPNNDVCGVEIYSSSDRDISVPNVAAHCQQLGKPWFLAAWSACLRDVGFSGDNTSFTNDADMATHTQDMYNLAKAAPETRAPKPAMASVGSDFWNLGTKTTKPTCDISPSFPKTWAAVQQNAP